MKIIYTNISPTTNAYTNFNHIFYLKKQKPQKVYFCIWDLFVYESPILNASTERSKKEKLKANVQMLEALMKHLNLNYKIIYLSEVWARALRNQEASKLYHSVLATIDLEKIRKGFSLEYIPFGDISLSRINYIILDYIAATYLAELFPEFCNGQPTHYLTSERFKVFRDDIDHLLKIQSRYSPPTNIYVTGVPVIIHQKDRIIPSSEMSKDTIQRIVESHYKNKKPSEKEISELFDVLFSVLDTLEFENNKLTRDDAEKIIAKLAVSDEKRSKFIDTSNEFEKVIKPLNEIKLTILRLCDGKNSILEISKKSELKLSTVSTYVTQLRNSGLVSLEKKPKRTVEHLVLNLGGIETNEKTSAD